MEKGVAVSASIDIGNNIAELLKQLASQIGTTADKIYPLYVKQAVLSGYIDFVVIIVSLILCFTISRIGWNLMKKDDDWTPLFIVPLIMVFVGVASMSTIITKIKNPEYHAIKKITEDFGKLVK